MLTLLNLPPLVRTKIWQDILTSSLDPTRSLEELHDQERQRKIQRIHRHGHHTAEIAIERCIQYPFSVYLPFAGLLKTSSGIRSDVKDAMAHLKTKRLVYKLDLVVENEVTILPSWLSCPARSMELARLDIDVRLLGSISDAENTLAGLQQHARDRCRTLAFAIVALIARFIERGPRFEHLRHSSGEIKIQTIMLNFHAKAEHAFSGPVGRQERADSLEEERGLMDHLNLSEFHNESEHGTISSTGSNASDSDSHSHRDLEEVVEGKDLLRTVDLVLRPLCRHETWMLGKRQKHFSMAHLALIRRNVRKICFTLDGMPEKAMMVENKQHEFLPVLPLRQHFSGREELLPLG